MTTSTLEQDTKRLAHYLKTNAKVKIRKEGDNYIVCPVERPSFWINSGADLHPLVEWCDSHLLKLDKAELINVVEDDDCWRCKNCGAEWSFASGDNEVPEICTYC